jgi:acetyltransferase-like isoleucine patch superfamily enzyme
MRLGERLFRARVFVDVVRHLSPPCPSLFARFGARSLILPPARVSSPGCIEVGDDVVFLEHAWLSVRHEHPDGPPPRLVVGDRVRFGRLASIACIGEVVIGDDVMASDGVFVADCFHRYDDPSMPVLYQPMSDPEPVRIGPGAYLGAGAVVLPGVTVGAGAYVGEGAVVTRDVPDHTVVMGNPARPVTAWEGGRWTGPGYPAGALT